MHDDFAYWYKLATTGTEAAHNPDLHTRRWKGVENALKDLESGQELDLVRLLTRIDSREVEFLGAFREAFKKADSSFSARGNDLEVSILAGAALAQLMKSSPGLEADRAALALLASTSLLDTSGRNHTEPFTALAAGYLDHRSKEQRKAYRAAPPKLKAEGLADAIGKFNETLPTGDFTKIQAAAKAALPPLIDALTKFADATTRAVQTLAYNDVLRREESEVLWWMTAEYSRDLDRKMAEVKLPGAAILAGKELADLVSAPGPFAAKSVIDRVLSTCGAKAAYRKSVALGAAVAALPAAWRDAVAKAEGVEHVRDLCPVLGAVHTSLTTEGASDWHPAYKKAYARDAAGEVPAVDLAVLAYREWLLVRAAAALS